MDDSQIVMRLEHMLEREPHDVLEESIRKGRAREFESFKAFAGDHPTKKVPDPTDAKTFERSKIDWGETGQSPYAQTLTEAREMLALRQREIVPLLASGFIESSFERVGDGEEVQPPGVCQARQGDAGRRPAARGGARVRPPLWRPGQGEPLSPRSILHSSC